MSFGYLPLPLFLIMILIVTGILIYYLIKGWGNDPKILSLGIFIFGISSLGAGVNRLGEELRIFGDRLLLINSFTFWITVIGTILLIIGGLQKVKDDPIRKRFVLIMTGILVLIVLLMAILVLYQLSHR